MIIDRMLLQDDETLVVDVADLLRARAREVIPMYRSMGLDFIGTCLLPLGTMGISSPGLEGLGIG